MKQASPVCIACGVPTKIFIDQIWDDRYGCPGVFSIFECEACEHMVTTPCLTEADLPLLYSTYYPRGNIDYNFLKHESALVNERYAVFKRWLAGTDNQGHYLAKPGQQVLDIGCGSCLSLLELRQLGAEPYGIEADPNVSIIAQHYDLNVFIGNIYDNPFPGKIFDLIVLNQVIEHVPDPSALLGVVRGRLSPGGRVVLAFPNVSSWQRRLWGSRWINWHIPFHQHHFNRRSFALVARKQGYELESVRTITPNLWTLLQLRGIGRRPEEGMSSDCWQNRSAIFVENSSFVCFLKKVSLKLLRMIVSCMLIIVNRTADLLGIGDSLLVVMKAKED